MADDDGELDVVTFLQKAGQQYREHIQLLRAEAEKAEAAQMRSTPVICPYEKITDRDRGKIGDRLYKLWEKRQAMEKAKKETRVNQEQAKEVQECTFQPKVTKAAKELPHRGSQGHISEEFLKKHAEKVERLKQDALKREVEEIAPRPRSLSRDSEHDHRHGLSVEDYLLLKEKERQAKMYQLAEQPIQGKPFISERAKRMERPGDVVSRLYDPDHRPVAYDENPPTFHPQIHSTYADPLEDLPVHERVLRREVHHKSRIGQPDRTPPGKPRISEKSERLVRERNEKMSSMDHSVSFQGSPGSRLYEAGRKQIEERTHRAAIERDATNKFPFKPTLSEESQKLIKEKRRGTSVGADAEDGRGSQKRSASKDDHLYQLWKAKEAERKRIIAAKKAELEQEALKECTFTPSRGVSPISKAHHSQDFSGWMNMSKQWEEKRKQRIHDSLLEKAEQELLHCTFQPAIHKEVPVLVSAQQPTGFNRHIQRLQKAREEEHEKLEQLESGSTTPRRAGRMHESSVAMSRDGKTPQSTRRGRLGAAPEALRPPVSRYDVPDTFYDEAFDPPTTFTPGKYASKSRAPISAAAAAKDLYPSGGGNRSVYHHTVTPSKFTGASRERDVPTSQHAQQQHVNRTPGATTTTSSAGRSPGVSAYRSDNRPAQPALYRQHSAPAFPTSAYEYGSGPNSNPSPEDYILQTHQAIVRNFRR